MNAYNPKHALTIALALFMLLAGCSFPVDRESPTTSPEENRDLFSITPTATPIASAAPTEIVSTPFMPSPPATLTSTIAASPTDNQQNTPVNESSQQPLASVSSTEPPIVPGDKEATPTMAPAQPDTPSLGGIQEITPTIEQPTESPLVIDGVIFPDSEDPRSKLTPTPCFICTLE